MSTDSIPSPCISVCRVDERNGWCEGCLRTLDEIAHWSVYDGDEKRAVWKLLPARRTERDVHHPLPTPAPAPAP